MTDSVTEDSDDFDWHSCTFECEQCEVRDKCDVGKALLPAEEPSQ